MEGPSLKIAAEQLQAFKNKRVLLVWGNTKVGKEIFNNKKVGEVFAWGKHLVIQFEDIALKVHFLLFGTYEAEINGQTVTGDYVRSREPRLAMKFKNGEIRLFNCSVKLFETNNLRSTYDFSIDILADEWDNKKALKIVKDEKSEMVADVLLDQEIFAGVGNIIKNEVLWLCKINPAKRIKDLNDVQLKEVIKQARDFSEQFYEWKKEFVLRKNLQVHRRKLCPNCESKIIREKLGKRDRWAYWCPICQAK